MESGKKETNYWPGFVDALSGLTLALVLVMVIFVVAMFSFAAELAKRNTAAAVEKEIVKLAAASEAAATAAAVASSIRDAETIASMQRQIEKLKGELRQADSLHNSQPVDVRRNEKAPSEGSGVSIQDAGAGAIVVHFSIGSFSLTPDARAKLEPILDAASKANPGATHELEASIGSETYSEARRNAYFRVMAIRNLLIERGLSTQKIESRINDSRVSEKAGEGSVVIRIRRK